MDRDELHARVRRLIFSSPALSEAFSKGDFRSVFKGRGVDFEALREYEEGDDARLIDWNVTVRLAKPFVRLYREDRSLTLFLLIDLSASMDEGGGEISKADMAILASSLLGYAASVRGMSLGALLFAKEPLRYFEPRKGKAQALAIIEAALALSASPQGASVPVRTVAGLGGPSPSRGAEALGLALDTAGRLLKRRSLVIASSDFHARGYESSLARLGRRHDLVALRVTDALDRHLPAWGSFLVRDAEGTEKRHLPLRSPRLRETWQRRGEDEAEAFRETCLSSRVAFLELDTAADPARALLEFFGKRRKG